MKNLLKLATGFLLLITLAANANATPVQFSGNDNWYEVVIVSNTWDSANSAADALSYKGLDGHLATVTSLDEWNFIKTLSQYGGNLWLGGTDSATEGTWEWVTGEAFNFTVWASGEPNNLGNEDCLETWHSGNDWNDSAGSTANSGYIVEYESASTVPEPATMVLVGIGLLGITGMGRKKRN